ncbi:MAG: cytochrome c oxidase subunit 3, partial [Rhodospirillaceae bacterium]
MASSESNHPYHLVNPSQWPFVGSVAAMGMAIGGIHYMHGGTIFGFLAGLALMLFVMFVWWRDVIREAQSGVDHTSVVKHGLRVGMVLFITSEVMFFFAFFWAFFAATIPAISRTAHDVWPPAGVVPFEAFDIPFLNTLILLTSGATVTVAHHKIQHGDRAGCGTWLAYTVVLGLMFTGLQAYEYIHATFGFKDGI